MTIAFNDNGKPLSLETFLSEYWQKKPCLIKAGFADFIDPLTPEELAGLATEEEGIESRIVCQNTEQKWQVHQGPFQDFALLGESHSTLLVQAVDHWHPEAKALLDTFNFLPKWRIDDLMVSFSTPDGGVGPHSDQYDVFIIQGQGSRRWRVGSVNHQLETHVPCNNLLQVRPFEAIIDEALSPGDILYIPPGAPHEGYAITPAMNYSVGFRAPSQTELLTTFADHLIDEDKGKTRYQDGQRADGRHGAAIADDEVTAIKALIKQALDTPDFEHWLVRELSMAKHEMDILPAEDPYTATEVTNLLAEGVTFYKTAGVRALYRVTGDTVTVSCCGEYTVLPKELASAIATFAESDAFTALDIDELTSNPQFIHLLTTLLNEGLWFTE